MNAQLENPLPEQTDWKRFLKSAETLIKLNSLQEQSEFLTINLAKTFGTQAKFWFAHPMYPLPGEEIPELVDSKANPHPLVMAAYEEKVPQFSDGNGITANLPNKNKIMAASFPVICNGDLLGVVLLEPKPGKSISSGIIPDVIAFLSLCAMSLQIHRQTVLKNWRMGQLSIVRKVSDNTVNVTDLDQLCLQVAEAVRERFHYYFVAIFTCEKNDVLLCRSSSPSITVMDGSTQFSVQPGKGIVGWAADHKEEIYVEDTGNHPAYRSHEQLPDTHSEAAMPLMIGERLLGVLDVQSNEVKGFHEMDLVVLRTLADNIAIAIEGAHLFANLQRRTEQISTIFDISQALSSILDLDMLLDEIVKTIQQKFQYLMVNVYTVHNGRGKIFYRAGTGEKDQAYREAFPTYDIQDPLGILPWVAREGKTFLSNDVLHEPQYRLPGFLSPVTRSEISVPLITGGEVVGILDIQSNQLNAFDQNDTFLFEALSAGIATTIRNATLFRSEQFRRQVAESVRDIAGILSNGSSSEELMNRILEKLQDSLPCDAASIWLTSSNSHENGRLTLAASRGLPTGRSYDTLSTNESPNGLMMRALRSDEPQIRTQADPIGPLGQTLGFPQDYSAIAAPLRAGGETVGILTLAHHQNDRYGSEARLITQTFAGYAAAAIQNNRLYETAREQAWVSAVLLKTAESNKNARNSDELFKNTANLIPELIGCSCCAIYQLNAPLGIFERKATNGFSPDALPARSFPLDHPAFLFAQKLLAPVEANYSNGEFCLAPGIDTHTGVLIPLAIRDRILGMIWVGNTGGQESFSQDTLHVLTGISDQTATTIENLQLIENQQLDAFIAAALLQVAQTVASQDDLHTTLDSILNLLRILAGIETAAFFLQNPNHEGFLPITSFIGFDQESLRSMGTQLIPGDFPLLDLVIDRKKVFLSPLSNRQNSAVHWAIVKHAYRLKDASQQKPPESGWLVGIPLVGRGEVLGALIIIEKPVTGSLLEKRMDLLTGIARQAGLAIQNDGLQDEKLEKEKLQQEFQFARDIQQTFLPRQIPIVKGWDVSSLWQPANQVGGDFFDFFLTRPDTFCAVVADVSDKGMPAALYMTVTRTLIRSFAQEYLTPGQILKKVNDLLLQDNPAGMFVTTTIVIGSKLSGTIMYANAGHNPPILCSATSQIKELPKGQIALGVLENQVYEDHNLEIDPQSFVILFSDGVTDTTSPGGENYSTQRLTKLISTNRFKRADGFTYALENDLIQFRAGLPSVDDITVLALRRTL